MKKDKTFNKSIISIIAVIFITLLGILLRLIPSFKYPIWGIDFGVYYNLTSKIISTNEIFANLPSVWGTSGYGSFPVFYWMMDIVYKLTGFSVQFILLHFSPIFAGFTIPIVYLIAKKLTENNEISIISSLLFAINPLEVFETSMVGLLIFGHIFLLLSILFYLYTWNNTKYYVPLSISSFALILSHHLSTFMFIISIIGIIFFRKIFDENYRTFKYDFIYLLIFSIVTFYYWLAFVPSMYGFFSGAFNELLPWYTVLILYFAIIIMILLYAHKFKNFILFLEKIYKIIKNRYLYLIFFLISFTIFLVLATIGINGMKITDIGILFALPFIFLFSFVGIGLKYISDFPSTKIFLIGWSSFLALFLFLSTITWNGILIPYRYIEYLFEPLSIISAIGIYYTYKQLQFNENIGINVPDCKSESENKVIQKRNRSENKPFYSLPLNLSLIGFSFSKRKGNYNNIKRIFAILLGISIILSIGTIYPLAEQVSGISENYVTNVMMSGIIWLEKNGNKNYSVATDAVDGIYLDALGFNTTFEYTYKLWISTDWYDALYELEGFNGTFPKVGYVLINSNMYYNGVYGYQLSLNPSYDPPVIISKVSFEKFFKEPFQEVYYNSSKDGSQWVYVFQVNWTYIYNHAG